MFLLKSLALHADNMHNLQTLLESKDNNFHLTSLNKHAIKRFWMEIMCLKRMHNSLFHTNNIAQEAKKCLQMPWQLKWLEDAEVKVSFNCVPFI